jgi:hypothetical protein
VRTVKVAFRLESDVSWEPVIARVAAELAL